VGPRNSFEPYGEDSKSHAPAKNQTPTVEQVDRRYTDLAKSVYSVSLFNFIRFDYTEYIIIYTGVESPTRISVRN
jgi:hypothetical protein